MDEYTVDFILKQPDPVLLTKLPATAPAIVPPGHIQEKGEGQLQHQPGRHRPVRSRATSPMSTSRWRATTTTGAASPSWTRWSTAHRRAGHPGGPNCRPAASTSPRSSRWAWDRNREEVRQRRRDLHGRPGGVRAALQHQERHHPEPRRAPRADHGRGPRRHRQAAAGPGPDHRQLPGPQSFGYNPSRSPALQSRRRRSCWPRPASSLAPPCRSTCAAAIRTSAKLPRPCPATCKAWACAPRSSHMKRACCSTTSSPAARPARCGRTSGRLDVRLRQHGLPDVPLARSGTRTTTTPSSMACWKRNARSMT